MKELKKILEEKKIFPSFHRLKILEYLIKNRTHPTVEEIHRDLSREITTLSKTTVYNTLKLFMDKGIVTELTVEGTESRYDINTKPHAHFKCLKCGKIYDLSMDLSIFNLKEIEEHRIMECHVYFKGICKECLEEEK